MNRSEDTSFLAGVGSTLAYQLVNAKLEFAVQLKKVMDREGVTASELAKRLDVSRPMVSKLLGGDTNVTIDTMVKAAYCLGNRLHLNLVSEHASPWFAEVIHGKVQTGKADRTFSAARFERVGEASGDVAKAA